MFQNKIITPAVILLDKLIKKRLAGIVMQPAPLTYIMFSIFH